MIRSANKNMGSTLTNALKASAAALRAEGERGLVISQNIAASETLPTTPGGAAYQRKLISFTTKKDKDGIDLVVVNKVTPDPTPAAPLFMPEHPGANAQGYVNRPNVNNLVELTDAKESNLNYTANLGAMQKTLSMIQETINVLK